MLTQELLKTLLHYDPETGEFRWRATNTNRVRVGDIAGSVNSKGYRVVMLLGLRFRASHLAWLYMTGSLPQREMDHKNGTCLDDRFCNLREATRSENTKNKRPIGSSGVRGVCWSKKEGKWYVRVSGVTYLSLGYFDNIFDAAACSISARNKLHGEFSYENRHAPKRASTSSGHSSAGPNESYNCKSNGGDS